jgi:hypothetical protein
MNKNISYLKYILKHKWYVLKECCRLGIVWRGLTHDLSKFLPSEWIPYRNFFYGKYHSVYEFHGDVRNDMLIHGVTFKEEVDDAFNYSWLKHIHRNPHHWQHWILHYDNGTVEARKIPEKYLREMLADWIGAGLAITGKKDIKEWYYKNRDNIVMHPKSRAWIESMIEKEEC